MGVKYIVIAPDMIWRTVYGIGRANARLSDPTKYKSTPIIDARLVSQPQTQASAMALKGYYEDREKCPTRGLSDQDNAEILAGSKDENGCIECVYCHKSYTEEYINKDHVIPFYFGGTDSFDNVRMSCKSCNLMKGSIHKDKMPVSWGIFQDNIKNEVKQYSLDVIEKALTMELSEKERHMAEKIKVKELEWREEKKQRQAEKEAIEIKVAS